MKNAILLIICAAIFGCHFFFKGHDVAPDPSASTPVVASAPAQQFQCDGRTHCSQMTSCEEAQFFLDNCPGTAMDGE